MMHSNKMLYSWVAPTGKIFPIDTQDGGHIISGKKFLKTYHKTRAQGYDVYHTLYKFGWVRVVYYGRNVYMNSTQKPNDKQIKSVKDEAIIAGKSAVIWDNDEGEITLWEKIEESKLKMSKYSVRDINIRGKIYNLYPEAYDIKDAIKRATYHILKDQNMEVVKDFGRIYSYILGNYYAGYIQVLKLPEQSNLFDHTEPSFKNIFYESPIAGIDFPRDINDKLEQYNVEDFSNKKLIGKFKDLNIYQEYDKNHNVYILYCLNSDNKLIVYYKYEKYPKYIKTRLTWNHREYRGTFKDLLINYLLPKFKTIESDNILSNAGFNFWKKIFVENPDLKFYIRDNGKIFPIEDVLDFEEYKETETETEIDTASTFIISL